MVQTVVIYYGVSVLFALGVVYYFFFWRKRKHQSSFPDDWKKFKQAVQKNNSTEILHYGTLVLWNDSFEKTHQAIIYKELKQRILDYPELEPIWKEVYYRTHGVEPKT